MKRIVTIIGSRDTPCEILSKFRTIAYYCASNNIIVRSGKAGGADAAALTGCMKALENGRLRAKPEMYTPWPKFGEDWMISKWDSVQGSNTQAILIAKDLHPAWERCSQGAKKLHTRNVCQILGVDINTPSDLVVYWCPESKGKPTGGTATAVNLAVSKGIPVINALHDGWQGKVNSILRNIKE